MPVLFGAAVNEDEISCCFIIDLSQNKQAQGKLNHLAYHDALTDLPNQSLFKDRLKQAIALSHSSNQMQAVLLLNLDRFKTVNDSARLSPPETCFYQSVAQTFDELRSRLRYGCTVWQRRVCDFAHRGFASPRPRLRRPESIKDDAGSAVCF